MSGCNDSKMIDRKTTYLLHYKLQHFKSFDLQYQKKIIRILYNVKTLCDYQY